MARRIFKRLVSLEDALAILKDNFEPARRVERVALLDALGRVLAEDVSSPVNIPPFPRSMVDGYAVRGIDVAGADEENPVKLRVVRHVEVGMDASNIRIGPGEAAEIDTGAMIPRGVDAVVPVEYTARRGGDVYVYKSVRWGENIAWPGSDVHRGMLLARKGKRLDPVTIGALAAAGVSRVTVYAEPVVAVISTGYELVEPGSPLPPGSIYDSNTYLLASMLLEIGARPLPLGIVRDEEDAIERILDTALEKSDVVLFSGGTSAGPRDLVYRVLDRRGVILFHGLKMKPGKPTLAGIVRGKPVFGLPGNPLSAAFVFKKLVAPFLKWYAGTGLPEERTLNAELAVEAPLERGRRNHVPVILIWNKERRIWSAYPTASSSYMVISYSRSDGYFVVPETTYAPPGEGSRIEVVLNREPPDRGWVIVGEYLKGLEGIEGARFVEAGTSTGLIAFRRGDADVAIISRLHPLAPNAGLDGRILKRMLVLASRSPRPSSMAAYPAGVGLEHLRRRIAVELGLEAHVVPVKGPRAAAVLLGDGVVDSALLPEDLVPGDLLILGRWEEELVLVARREAQRLLDLVLRVART